MPHCSWQAVLSPISYNAWQHAHRISAEELPCVPVCAWMHTCVCKGMLLLPLPVVRQLLLCSSQVTFFFLFISFLPLFSYGRVYTADPYHALAPAASYGVGAVVSGIFFLVLFLISRMGNSHWVSCNETSPTQKNFCVEGGGP